MSAKIAVVKPAYQIEEAYRMGYDRFEPADDADDADHPIAHFKESGEWANGIAPRIRAMAGYRDDGRGTYQLKRQVAAIEPGAEEDNPAAAQLVPSEVVREKLVDAFDHGAAAALSGDEKDPSVVRW